MRAFAAVLAFAASALAYSVSEPNNATGWSTEGQNTVTWTKVSTDRSNFTIVLSNQASYPPYQQVLAALVNGDDGTTQVNPPSTGWPQGTGFQVNIVEDAQHLNSILAQSEQFSILPPKSSSASASTTGLTISNTLSTRPTASATSPSNGNLNPTTSDTSTSPTGTNAASPAMGVQAAFFGVVALVGAVLA